MTGPDGAGQAERELLAGWGRAAPSRARVERPRTAEQLRDVFERAVTTRTPLIARGLGRAYNDAAQCGGGLVLDCTGLDQVLELDAGAGVVHAASGCSLDAVMRRVVPEGWFVPVTPGTRFVTVGGAVAADVHGKNHHRDGGFGEHVRRVVLLTPSGRRELTPADDTGLLDATLGGLGLTGAVEEVSFALRPVETSTMLVDTERAEDLDDCMARMSERDDDYRYSVAWVDCLASGRHLGRAVLTRGDHARRADLGPKAAADPLAFAPRTWLAVPVAPPPGLLNPLTVAAFNEAWYRRAPRSRTGELQSIPAFFHPLDGIAGWNLLYGRRGFAQYQVAVPFGQEACVRRLLEQLSAWRVPSFLAVLKRFGRAGRGMISFPFPGWTLALDFPLGSPGLSARLDELDEQVLAAGGRVYLAKDGRVRPSLLRAMYPRLGEWEGVVRGVDPDGLLRSDLRRRLGLAVPGAPALRDRPAGRAA